MNAILPETSSRGTRSSSSIPPGSLSGTSYAGLNIYSGKQVGMVIPANSISNIQDTVNFEMHSWIAFNSQQQVEQMEDKTGIQIGGFLGAFVGSVSWQRDRQVM